MKLDEIIEKLMHQDINSFVHENRDNIEIIDTYEAPRKIIKDLNMATGEDFIMNFLNSMYDGIKVDIAKSKQFRKILNNKYEPRFYFTYDKNACRYVFVQDFPRVLFDNALCLHQKLLDLDKDTKHQLFSILLLLFGDIQCVGTKNKKDDVFIIFDGLCEVFIKRFGYPDNRAKNIVTDVLEKIKYDFCSMHDSFLDCDNNIDRIIMKMNRQFVNELEYNSNIFSTMTVYKTVEFDSAHHLEDHPAKCYNLHGGHYVLTVGIRGFVNAYTGMVIDYTYLKKILNELVVNKYDHHYLNGVDGALGYRSTTENIAKTIWNSLERYIPNIESIKLYETETSYVEINSTNF